MPDVNVKKRAVPAASVGRPPTIVRLSEDAAPRHERVKRHLSEAILAGEWATGAVLPSEVELARAYGVAVGTVRRAMSDLVAEGLLTRRRKTGTVVTGRTPHHSLRFFFHYFRLHGADGTRVRSSARMLACAIEPAVESEAAQLGVTVGAPVIRLHRIRLVADRAIMHDRMVLDAARLPDFPTESEAVPTLLYLHLLERYGIRIAAVREQLTSELATAEDAALLDLVPPAPVLAIREVAYDQAGLPTILALHRATTAGHHYVNEVS